jgi:cytidylate kinase
VSEVAAISEVRKRLVALQQEMGKGKGVVMDGRDIGTVVFPDAELKIFMTASAQVRAQRRFDELKEKGQRVSFEDVFRNVVERDETDSNRADSPLIMAKDARLLDNSEISREAQFNLALGWAKEAINK